MNKLRDTDLREALRRREAKRTPVEVPTDFLDNVMQEIGNQHSHRTRRTALAALAVAASIALFFVLNNEPEAAPAVSSDNTVCHVKQQDTLCKTVAIQQIPRQQTSRPSVRPTRSTKMTDDTDYYIAQMESDLADVRDSCYLAQVERMISDNEELQQLMNELTNYKQ
ncbi:MAG: hypothetical protein J6O54_07130 [Prevotella sp.]|nr:hypothetical protein [Prevotella sp.]